MSEEPTAPSRPLPPPPGRRPSAPGAGPPHHPSARGGYGPPPGYPGSPPQGGYPGYPGPAQSHSYGGYPGYPGPAQSHSYGGYPGYPGPAQSHGYGGYPGYPGPAQPHGYGGYPGYPGIAAKPIPSRIGRGAGPVPLRPLDLGDVLDGAFKLLAANSRAALLIAAIFVVPVQLAAAYLQRSVFALGFFDLLTDPGAADLAVLDQSAAGTNAASLVSLLATGLVLPFIAGAVCVLVAGSYLAVPVTWGQALRAAGRRWAALTGSWWLHVLAYLSLAVPGFLLAVLGGAAGALLGILLGLLGVVGLLFVVPLFALTAPAIVTEGLGPVAGLRRSVRLVRRRYWPTLGTVLLTGIMIGAVAGLLGLVPQVFALVVGGSYAWVVSAAGAIVGNVLSLPLTAIVATLLYFDLRIRSEGFDLQILAASMGATAPPRGGPPQPEVPGFPAGGSPWGR